MTGAPRRIFAVVDVNSLANSLGWLLRVVVATDWRLDDFWYVHANLHQRPLSSFVSGVC